MPSPGPVAKEEAVSADDDRPQQSAAISSADEEPGRARGRRAFLVGAGAAVAGSVLAAGGSGLSSLVAPASRMPRASASPSSGVSRKGLGRGVVTRGADIEVKKGSDVVIDAVTLAPGGTTGWHTHPGPEVVLVTSGVLTFRRLTGVTCVTEKVSAGEASVGAAPGEVHMAHNQGPDPVEMVVAFFNVPSGEPSRVEADPPLTCP